LYSKTEYRIRQLLCFYLTDLLSNSIFRRMLAFTSTYWSLVVWPHICNFHSQTSWWVWPKTKLVSR